MPYTSDMTPPGSPSTLTMSSSFSTIVEVLTPAQERKATLVLEVRDLVLHHEFLNSKKVARENEIWNMKSQLGYRGFKGVMDVKAETKEMIEAQVDGSETNAAYWAHIERAWDWEEIEEMEREVSSSIRRTLRTNNDLRREKNNLIDELDRLDSENSPAVPRSKRVRYNTSGVKSGAKPKRARYQFPSPTMASVKKGLKVAKKIEKMRAERKLREGDVEMVGKCEEGKGRGEGLSSGWCEVVRAAEGGAEKKGKGKGEVEKTGKGKGKRTRVVVDDVVMADDFVNIYTAEEEEEKDELEKGIDEVVEEVWEETLRGPD